MSPKYEQHKEFKRKCSDLDRSYGSDWNTCLRRDNPTAIKICSPDWCPKIELWTIAQYRQLNHLDMGK